MDKLSDIVNWTNLNSGFLSILLFLATILYGWLSGLFNSIIKKPKLKVRFIDKLTFYSFYNTGNIHINKNDQKVYDAHKIGFVVYMSIANLGNIATSIDKICLAYYKNKPYKWYHLRKEKVWLVQWHSIDNFKIPIKNDRFIHVNHLTIKKHEYDTSNSSFLNIGDSLIGVAYFEQGESWGNYSPFTNDNQSTDIIIKIKDIYGRKYCFKTQINYLELEDARKYNAHFGNIEYLIQ